MHISTYVYVYICMYLVYICIYTCILHIHTEQCEINQLHDEPQQLADPLAYLSRLWRADPAAGRNSYVPLPLRQSIHTYLSMSI